VNKCDVGWLTHISWDLRSLHCCYCSCLFDKQLVPYLVEWIALCCVSGWCQFQVSGWRPILMVLHSFTQGLPGAYWNSTPNKKTVMPFHLISSSSFTNWICSCLKIYSKQSLRKPEKTHLFVAYQRMGHNNIPGHTCLASDMNCCHVHRNVLVRRFISLGVCSCPVNRI
jgi:hypothetical protein